MEPMWMWAAIGIILLAVEMATGTFYVLWFGVAALLVAAILLVNPTLSWLLQCLSFAVLSLSALTVWTLNYKKTETHSRVGQSLGEEIGRVGTVTAIVSPAQTGKISFAQGLMGSREWMAIADETINVQENAKVVAVEGNILRVKKTK